MRTIFVYGTLKKGGSNHALLEGATFIGNGITKGKHLMLDTGGFPVVLDTNEVQHVSGELYEVDDSIVHRLDQLEGHPHMFTRTPIEVDVNDAGVYQATEIYFGNKHHWLGRKLREAPRNEQGYFDWGVD